jgi:hypothetical protein
MELQKKSPTKKSEKNSSKGRWSKADKNLRDTITKGMPRQGKHRVVDFVNLCRNFLDVGPNESIKSRLAKTALISPDKFTRHRRYLQESARTVFGTIEPVIRFHRNGAATLAGTTGVFNPVVSIGNQPSALYDEFEAIFDEVRAAGAFQAIFHSLVTSTAHEWAVGVIDYWDATALSSVEVAQSYDTQKTFCLNPYIVGGQSDVVWDGHVQGTPDREWSGTSSNVVYAYWKAYNYVGVTGSTTYGALDYVLMLQFRAIGPV